PCDVAHPIFGPKAERSETPRYAGARMVAGENGSAPAFGIHHRERGRLIRSDPGVDICAHPQYAVASPARPPANPGAAPRNRLRSLESGRDTFDDGTGTLAPSPDRSKNGALEGARFVG